jgi:hypothetical protein
MRRYAIAVLFVAALFAGVFAVVGRDGSQAVAVPTGHPQVPVMGGTMIQPRGNWDKAKGAAFRQFPLYSAGEQFRDLPLNAIVRVAGPKVPGEVVRSDHVTFMYGSCEAIDGAGCAVPLQVQVWDACERNRGSYELGPPNAPPGIQPDADLQIRGVPAAFFEGFTRLELYSAQSTIVLYTERADKAFLMDAAEGLVGVNVKAPSNAALPAPAANAVPLGCNKAE